MALRMQARNKRESGSAIPRTIVAILGAINVILRVTVRRVIDTILRAIYTILRVVDTI